MGLLLFGHPGIHAIARSYYVLNVRDVRLTRHVVSEGRTSVDGQRFFELVFEKYRVVLIQTSPTFGDRTRGTNKRRFGDA